MVCASIYKTQAKSPMLRVYIYIDDVFQYKTEIIGQSFEPILDLKIKMNLPEHSNHVRLDMYDASNLSDEQIKKFQSSSEYVGSPGEATNANPGSSGRNSRVLSVTKEASNEPQDFTPGETSRDEEDDDQDSKEMVYIGTSIVTIDRILNKLMFDEKCLQNQRFQFETNQNIVYDQKKMEPQGGEVKGNSASVSQASNDPKIRGKISLKFKCYIQSDHYYNRVEHLIEKKKTKISKNLQEIFQQVTITEKIVREASANILYTEFIPNYGLEIQSKPKTHSDERSAVTSFYPNHLRNSNESSDYMNQVQFDHFGAQHHFYNTQHFDD